MHSFREIMNVVGGGNAEPQPIYRILANGRGKGAIIISVILIIEGHTTTLGCRCETDTQNDEQGRAKRGP